MFLNIKSWANIQTGRISGCTNSKKQNTVTKKLHKQIVHRVRFPSWLDWKLWGNSVFKFVQITFCKIGKYHTWYVDIMSYRVADSVMFSSICCIHCKISVNLQINELEPGTATCDLFQGGPATSFLRFDKPQLFTRDYFGCKPWYGF